MSKKTKDKQSDGYDSVIKEYDFYNTNDNDFEIIDEVPNDFMKEDNKTNFYNNQTNLEKFVVELFKIIFYSRNKVSEFYSKSRRKLNEKMDSSFQIDIEELIEYENLRASNNEKDNKKKKYFIDFYLIKNDDKNSLNSAKVEDCKKLLVERWKIKYKEEIKIKKNIVNFENFVKNKMKLMEKSAIAYSRLLPLFNFSKNDGYYIDFKFCPKTKKKFIDDNSTYKIKLINEDIYNFKLSIKYLKISTENIEHFLNKNSDDFIIIPSHKPRRRFLSDTYNKKPSVQFLTQIDENTIGKKGTQDYIIEDYVDSQRLSCNYDINKKKYLHSKFNDDKEELKEKESDDNFSKGSSDDNLALVINENDNEENINLTKSNHMSNKDKIKKINIIEDNEDFRKCQTYQNKGKIKKKQSNEMLDNLDIKNNFVKKIIKDYKNVKKIMKKMPDYGKINHKKLELFLNNN